MIGSQLRFQKIINKDKGRVAQNDPMKKKVDLPLSSEMSQWLHETLFATDAEGYPEDEVASVVTAPLDSELVYVPASAIVTSKHSSSRIPEPVYSTTMKRSTGSSSTKSSSSFFRSMTAEEPFDIALRSGDSLHRSTDVPPVKKPFVSEALSRLNVLWLQRRAQLEKEDGEPEKAMKTLDEALSIHIGDVRYEDARLFDKAMASGPEDLLGQIAQDYIVFDKSAHRAAGRIQRCVMRRNRVRRAASVTLSRVYRGYSVRRKMWIRNFRRTQCALIIQKRFRVHLIRIHYLCNRLKSWFVIYFKRKEYKRLLKEYRFVRRIQRRWRGNKGRAIANQKRLERDMTQKMHQNSRSFLVRRGRAIALRWWHKRFHEAALRIQCLVRKVQAVRRSQLQLLSELTRENIRYQHEKAVIKSTIKVELDRLRIYMQTSAGRIHLSGIMDAIRLKDAHFNKAKSSLSKKDVLAHEAMVSFELFDTDGSGQIDEEELANMLTQLCIPMNAEEVHKLATDMDADGSGDIDFGEFLDWYCGEGSDTSGGMTLGDAMFKQLLRARALIMELSGQTLIRRAERDLLRQGTTWKAKDIAATFRLSCPPKFQCCQCLRPFVLFTDYRSHFDTTGHCIVLNEPAVFYSKFWNRRAWMCQRQVEWEVMRWNDETPNINYATYMAWYADLSLQNDPAIALVMQKSTKQAQVVFMEKIAPHLVPGSSGGTARSMGSLIFDIVRITGDAALSPVIAKCVSDCLGIALPDEWLVSNEYTFEALQKWLLEVVDKHKSVTEKRNIRRLIFTEYQQARNKALIIGRIFVRVLRLMQIGAESALKSLVEYRMRRVRLIMLSDSDLERIDMPQLTEENFQSIRNRVVEKLSILARENEKLLLVEVPKRFFWSSTGGGFHKKHIQIGPDGSLTRETIMKLMKFDAHNTAVALYNSRIRSPVGVTQVRRYANEMWAHKQLLLAAEPQKEARRRIECRYFFDRFACEAAGEGIDHDDLEMICAALCIPWSDETLSALERELGVTKGQFLSFDKFSEWYLQGGHTKHQTAVLRLWKGFKGVLFAATLSTYKSHAKENIHANYRVLSRLENTLRNRSMKILVAGDATPHTKSSKKEINEKREEKLNLLKEQLVELQKKIEDIKDLNDKSELLILFRMTEDAADYRCKMHLLTPQGAVHIATEAQLVRSAEAMVEAYGYLLSPGATSPWVALTAPKIKNLFVAAGGEGGEGGGGHEQGWDLALEVLVHAFDTDCSGTMDEGEVRLLLECTRCGLSERHVLYKFPEVRLTSTTRQRVVAYLAAKVHWRRGLLGPAGSSGGLFVSTQNRMIVASKMLISLNRQLARRKVEEATTLARTGAMMEDEDEKTDSALMMRSQFFALRQVDMFLRTTQGQVKLTIARVNIKAYWQSNVVDRGFTLEGLIGYAYDVHREWGGMLVTELPHLVQFLVVRLMLRTKRNISSLQSVIAAVQSKDDLYWLTKSEICELLEDKLEFPIGSTRSAAGPLLRAALMTGRLRNDAIVNTYSKARQQAVMTAMRFVDIYVADTNYRCSILGLNQVIKAKVGLANDVKAKVKWQSVPREALTLLMLSKGYLSKDLAMGNMNDMVAADHSAGAICADEVRVRDMLSTLKENARDELSLAQRLLRIVRNFNPLNVRRYFEYIRMVKAIAAYQEDIDEAGATFLNEILEGISHCQLAEEEE